MTPISEEGTKIGSKTIFPKVISVSRATDIPAWHSEWLMERLRRGGCEWQNPFNPNQIQTVSFANVEAIVFWSKNPAPLIPHFPEIEARGLRFYFQFTLNDYEKERLEPGPLPSLVERIRAFKAIARNHHVIWRYDPVITGAGLTPRSHLGKVEYLLKRLGGYAEKLVFSFVDLYAHAERNLRLLNPLFGAPNSEEIREFVYGLAELRDKFAPHLKLAACAEETRDFCHLKIEKSSCVDPELINKLCGKEIFFKKPSLLESCFEKDKGQRKLCGCAPSKDIGSYRRHPCKHGCVYCYAGHGKDFQKE